MFKGLTISGGLGLLIGIAFIAYLRFAPPPGSPHLDGPGMVVTVALSIVVMTVLGGIFSRLLRSGDDKDNG